MDIAAVFRNGLVIIAAKFAFRKHLIAGFHSHGHGRDRPLEPERKEVGAVLQTRNFLGQGEIQCLPDFIPVGIEPEIERGFSGMGGVVDDGRSVAVVLGIAYGVPLQEPEFKPAV